MQPCKLPQMTNCAWIRAAATSATVNGVTFSGTIPYTGYSVDVVITHEVSIAAGGHIVKPRGELTRCGTPGTWPLE